MIWKLKYFHKIWIFSSHCILVAENYIELNLITDNVSSNLYVCNPSLRWCVLSNSNICLSGHHHPNFQELLETVLSLNHVRFIMLFWPIRIVMLLLRNDRESQTSRKSCLHLIQWNVRNGHSFESCLKDEISNLFSDTYCSPLLQKPLYFSQWTTNCFYV